MEFALAVLIPVEGGWMIKLGPDVPFHATWATDFAATQHNQYFRLANALPLRIRLEL
jgi:hypothetical protein